MTMVSVAMTTYNGAAYLHEQLSSLLMQTRKADEIVICDDGSSDDTLQILTSFVKHNHLETWHIIKNTDNLGYIENFRKAMSITSGDIVFLCDQDDIWESNKIERMLLAMEYDSSILAIASDYRLINGHGLTVKAHRRKLYISKEVIQSKPKQVQDGIFLHYNIAQGCACAYRRSLVDAYCASKTCGTLPHDWALNLMAHEKSGLFYLNEELLRYRIHENNTVGITEATQTVLERIPRLSQYAAYMADVQNLPVTLFTKQEALCIVSFTDCRIQWLSRKRLIIWLKGLFRHRSIVRKYFIKEYAKDFLLVLLRKIPSDML